LKNDLLQIPPNLYFSLGIQDYTMPKIEDITPYVFYICLLENHFIDPRDIISFCQLFNNDIRQILNQLQFRLLKLDKSTSIIQSKKVEEKGKKNDDVIVIDIDEDDDNTNNTNNTNTNTNTNINTNNDDKNNDKDNDNVNDMKKTENNIKASSKVNTKNMNDNKYSKIKPLSNEIVMEHLSLDQIMGIDLNLINIYNYYLRHHMRPDLALIQTIPDYVLLSKYEQLQYQLVEMEKEKNQLYYYSLNKLYETEAQQLTNLNNNYNVDIFDEWGIHDRGGALTWLLKYKKGNRKGNKNDNNPINDFLSPSSSVISSPGLRPLSDFTCKSK